MNSPTYSSEKSQTGVDILIVGAGMAGLSAASKLRQPDRHVIVVDKGRSVGGRLASRQIGQATFDLGAQFMTARESRFSATVDQWRKIGVLKEWYRKTSRGFEGHARWRGNPTMTAVAENLARNVDVLLQERIVALHHCRSGWTAQMQNGNTVFAGAVLLTPPIPQSLALMKAGGVELQLETEEHLESIAYESCLAVMAVLDSDSRIPAPGGLAPTGGPISWIADNKMKGISFLPAVTIHATAAFSFENWDRDRKRSGRTLLCAAEPWLGSKVTEFQIHGWRYSKPVIIDKNPCLILSDSPPLVLAGDVFGGSRVEGAALSGWAAAEALTRLLSKTG